MGYGVAGGLCGVEGPYRGRDCALRAQGADAVGRGVGEEFAGEGC